MNSSEMNAFKPADDNPKPSTAPNAVGKRHVRFKLPDTAEDEVIYPEPLANYGEDAMTCTRCRKWRPGPKNLPIMIDVTTMPAVTDGGTLGTSSASPAPLLLSHPPRSPLNSNSTADNKSLSSYKDDVGEDTATVRFHLLPPLCILQRMLIMLLLPANCRSSFHLPQVLASPA